MFCHIWDRFHFLCHDPCVPLGENVIHLWNILQEWESMYEKKDYFLLKNRKSSYKQVMTYSCISFIPITGLAVVYG